MPRYFIDFQDNDAMFFDHEGSDLARFEDVRREAVGLLAHAVKHELPDGDHHRFVATVRDERDVSLYRGVITFHGERLDGRTH